MSHIQRRPAYRRHQGIRIPIITKPSVFTQAFVDIPAGSVRALLNACHTPLGYVVDSAVNCMVTCKDGFLLFLTVHDERNKQLTVSLPLSMPPTTHTPFSTYLHSLWNPENTPEEFNTMDECETMLNKDLN